MLSWEYRIKICNDATYQFLYFCTFPFLLNTFTYKQKEMCENDAAMHKNHNTKDPTVNWRHRKTFNNVQSHLTGSTLIQLIAGSLESAN